MQKPILTSWSCLLVPLILSWPACAGEPNQDAPSTVQSPPDKSQYHLLNPTPPTLLRELSTDRPDKTESPITLDAGHFQLEMDLVSYTRDHDTRNGADTRTESYAVAPLNLKVGLLNSLDFQLVLPTWNWQKTTDRVAGTTTKQSGFGDIVPRVKYNVWGNDTGKTALGIMPFLKIPTSQDGLGNNSVEGGLILPFAFELPRGFGAVVMTEFDISRDEAGSGHHAEFINTITVGHSIVGKLDGYIEFFSQVSAESDTDWIGTFDVGFTYGLTPNMQLDAGVNIGVTRAADDINPFLGFSYRY